jgi:hypothetical protein
MDTLDLVGPDEIAARLDVAANTVATWRARYASFPAPLVTCSRVPVWHWQVIRAWASATGRRPAEAEQVASPAAMAWARERVEAIRAEVRRQLEDASDQAARELDAVAPKLRRPPNRERRLSLVSGRVETRSVAGGEYDWLYRLTEREQARLRARWMAPAGDTAANAPDQVADLMAARGLIASADIEAAMVRWLHLTRVVDAGRQLLNGSPLPDAYGSEALFDDLDYDPRELFGSQARAIACLAAQREASEIDVRPLPAPRHGPSPLDLSYDEWLAEVETLTAELEQHEQTAGEWLTVEHERCLSRLAELVPASLDELGALDTVSLFVAVHQAYLAAAI